MYLLTNQDSKTEGIKESWNRFEQLGVEAYIEEYFSEEYGISNAVEFFGLTFLSSGYYGYPAYYVASREGKEFILEKDISIKCFIIKYEETLIAVGEDEDEKEYFYNVIN